MESCVSRCSLQFEDGVDLRITEGRARFEGQPLRFPALPARGYFRAVQLPRPRFSSLDFPAFPVMVTSCSLKYLNRFSLASTRLEEPRTMRITLSR